MTKLFVQEGLAEEVTEDTWSASHPWYSLLLAAQSSLFWTSFTVRFNASELVSEIDMSLLILFWDLFEDAATSTIDT